MKRENIKNGDELEPGVFYANGKIHRFEGLDPVIDDPGEKTITHDFSDIVESGVSFVESLDISYQGINACSM